MEPKERIMILHYRPNYQGINDPFTAAPIKHHADCKWQIVLDDPIPNQDTDRISGTVKFFKLRKNSKIDDDQATREFYALRIQLESIITTQFQTKSRAGRLKLHRQKHQLFPPTLITSWANPAAFSFHFIREGVATNPQFSSVGTALHSFPFEIEMKNLVENFPAAFSSPQGSIVYKLVVYADNLMCEEKMLTAKTTPIIDRGYLKLDHSFDHDDDNAKRISTVINGGKAGCGGLFFSKKCKLDATLSLCGGNEFLPLEKLAFHLQVVDKSTNNGPEKFHKLQVALVQRISYFAQEAAMQTSKVVDVKEIFDVDSVEGGIVWENELQLPQNLMPTFTTNGKSIDIQYFVQFEVTGQEKGEMVKGEAGVIIGTNRRTEEIGGFDETQEEPATASDDAMQPSLDPSEVTLSISHCVTVRRVSV